MIESTPIPELKIIRPKKLTDSRGYFFEAFNFRQLGELGITFVPAQENQSLSVNKGTVRGLHFQRPPRAQAKIIRVLRGRILDVVVDIRVGSPTFKRSVSVELDADEGRQLYIPVGFAHGFCTLEPDTEVCYLIDEYYDAACDSVINWREPDFQIDWPEFAGASLSDKDSSAPFLKDIATPFLFPAHGSTPHP